MKIPREIDALMWEVAELDDLDTIDQFGARYPEFRNELVKRLQMVRSLRGSRPKSATPEFVPRQNIRQLGPSRLAIAMVSIIVIASMSFATYATVQYVRSSEEPVNVSNGTDYVLNGPSPIFEDSERGLRPSQIGSNQAELPPGSEQPLREFDAFLFPVTVESVDTTLVSVINELAVVSGTQIMIAPGFEDVAIRLTYVNQPLMGVLQDLGIRFGFTAVRDGATSLLIVPAVDKTGSRTVSAVGVAELILEEPEESEEPASNDTELDGETTEETGVVMKDNDN